MTDRSGTSYAGFLLLKQLPTLHQPGHYAELYTAKQDDSVVVLKIPRKGISPTHLQLFLYEVETLASLNHPDIVRVLAHSTDLKEPFMAMEQLRPCDGVYPPGKRVPLHIVVKLIGQLADALQYCHERGVIHRDVTHSNILFREPHHAILSDFGLALTPQSAAYWQQVSTPFRTTWQVEAPEHMLHGVTNALSDQYALATVAYVWICGRYPFDSQTAEQREEYVQLHDPEACLRLSSFMPEIPPAIEQVIMRALAKDPQQRYPSVEEFYLALGAAYYNDLEETAPPKRPITLQQGPLLLLSVAAIDLGLLTLLGKAEPAPLVYGLALLGVACWVWFRVMFVRQGIAGRVSARLNLASLVNSTLMLMLSSVLYTMRVIPLAVGITATLVTAVFFVLDLLEAYGVSPLKLLAKHRLPETPETDDC
ncbi:MAG TPA: bifunctional serine/threonine protein kinase/MFS transporter [Candidatus Acidoferrum sp.]|nr:bifunctional serine/threonine protein kinase/MFS transporter [Candidatus Acidoferrum sp.]